MPWPSARMGGWWQRAVGRVESNGDQQDQHLHLRPGQRRDGRAVGRVAHCGPFTSRFRRMGKGSPRRWAEKTACAFISRRAMAGQNLHGIRRTESIAIGPHSAPMGNGWLRRVLTASSGYTRRTVSCCALPRAGVSNPSAWPFTQTAAVSQSDSTTAPMCGSSMPPTSAFAYAADTEGIGNGNLGRGCLVCGWPNAVCGGPV